MKISIKKLNELAKLSFTIYNSVTGGKPGVSWDELEPELKTAWVKVAKGLVLNLLGISIKL